jgi:hypothetical protein
VSQSHGTTSDVHLAPVQAKHLLCGDGNDGERLVELPQVDLVLLDTGSLKGSGDSERWGSREVNRCTGGIGEACESAHTLRPIIHLDP